MNNDNLITAWSGLLRSSSEDVIRFIFTAPHRYKHYKIPKKTGGFRDIYHPTPELKAVQRWLNANIFSSLRIHDAVYSYRNGRSIKDHASIHLSSNYFLRLDFKDFFPSIELSWVEEFLRFNSNNNIIPCDLTTISTISHVVCRYSEKEKTNALSIGAPTSPILSNAILYDLDQAVSRLCSENDVIYSRYADDIYLSTKHKNSLDRIGSDVLELVGKLVPMLQINQKKTIYSSRKRKVNITGLNISTERNVSVGRELKRSVKTEFHLWCIGKLPNEKLTRLRGMISYVKGVEPSFFDALRNKFGAEKMESFLSLNIAPIEFVEIPF